MDENKKAAIEKIYQLTKQDAEFNEELRKKLEIASSASPVIIDDERLSQIYEYCIEKIISEQAENFYKNFPIKEIVNQLKDDFRRMEEFRRKNRFDDYSLALYQQIECIVNYIFSHESFVKTINYLWNNISYRTQKGEQRTISNDIFGSGEYLERGLERAKNNQFSANDKLKCVIYFIGGFWAANKYPADYIKLSDEVYDIYLCRNTNHRGSTQNDNLKKKLDAFSDLFSFSYFRFNAALVEFVRIVQDGWNKFVPQKCDAEIFSIFSSACFVRIEGSDQNEQIPEPLMKNIKGLKNGDKISLLLINDEIVGIINSQ